jgi:hypothetical protein
MLLTNFLVLATAGSTVDGREIKEQWLTDIAEQYDQELYAAVINADHERYYGNFGLVNDVKLGKSKDGKTTLLGRINPNFRLIEMNRNSQRLFFSIEVEPKFADTGKAYLMGLALTDSPASLGTTQLKFSAQDSNAVLTTPEPFLFSMPGDEATGLFEQFKTWFAGNKTTDFQNKPINQDDNEMTPEQLAELKTMFENQGQAQTDALVSLTSVVTTMAETFTESKPPELDEQENLEDQEQTDVEKLTAQVEALTKTVQELTEEKPPKAPNDNFGDAGKKKKFI